MTFDELLERAGREPLDIDLSHWRAETVAGFLVGQVNALHYLDELMGDHFLNVGNCIDGDGFWFLEHSLACRLAGMAACPHNTTAGRLAEGGRDHGSLPRLDH